MRPDTRSFSFTFLRLPEQDGTSTRSRIKSENLAPSPENKMKMQQKCGSRSVGRAGLRRFGTSFLNKMGKEAKYSSIEEGEDAEEMEETSTSSKQTRSLSKKLNKTVQDVKNSFESLSQKFKRTTRRRYRMPVESPITPISQTRKILGRTPTKLYSPFGFETPVKRTPKRLVSTNGQSPSSARFTKKKNSSSGGSYSPTNTFAHDVNDVEKGLKEFGLISRNVKRRSVRF